MNITTKLVQEFDAKKQYVSNVITLVYTNFETVSLFSMSIGFAVCVVNIYNTMVFPNAIHCHRFK